VNIFNLAFPLTTERGVTTHPQGLRYHLRDANGKVLGTFYGMHSALVLTIVQQLNRLGKRISERATSTPSEAWPKKATSTADAADTFEEAKFPAWMGETPRYGAQWSAQEDAVLKARWNEGMPLIKIAAAHGRDGAGIKCRLMRLYGDNYLEHHDVASKRLQRIEELGDELLKLMSEHLKAEDC